MASFWLDLLSRIFFDWVLPLSVVFAAVIAVLSAVYYWTRLGNDWLMAKCALLAILIHLTLMMLITQAPSPTLSKLEARETPISLAIRSAEEERELGSAEVQEVDLPSRPDETVSPLASKTEERTRELEASPVDPLPETVPPPPIDAVQPLEIEPTQPVAIETAPLEAPEVAPPANTPKSGLPDESLARSQAEAELARSLDAPPTAVPETPSLEAAPEPEATAPIQRLPTIDVVEAPATAAPAPSVESPPSDAKSNLATESFDRSREVARSPSRPSTDAEIALPQPRPSAASTEPNDIPASVPGLVTPVDALPVPASTPQEEDPKGNIEGILTKRQRELDGPVMERRDFQPGSPSRQIDAPLAAAPDIEALRSGTTPDDAVADAPASRPFWENRTAPNRLEIVQRLGGSDRTERAVALALKWLAAHQSDDGRWDSDGFHQRCPEGDRCEGAAIERQSDTGLTGLTLLAFLGAGHTHFSEDEYRETVRRGLSWLLRSQRPDGDLQLGGRIYCHAMATLALSEAYAMTKDERLKGPTQRAITWLAAAQHPESGGWRYGPKQYGDTSVFGWAILALRSAKQGGLEVPPTTWTLAKRWIPLVSSGSAQGLAAYRPGYPPSHAMTAEALYCRLALEETPSKALVDQAAEYVLSRLPDSTDYHLYFWYYGTLSMFQVGGERWDRWNDRLTSTLLDTQRQSGHAMGSWDPQSPFGVDGGRLFTTAASAMCLEVYYRYLPLYARRNEDVRAR